VSEPGRDAPTDGARGRAERPPGDRPRVAPALDPVALDALVLRAIAEDVGAGDATAEATVPAGTRALARVRQKAPGVVYGLELAERAFRALDPGAACERAVQEGVWREQGGPVLELRGDACALLSAERTALNFLAHLSGIATLTARCVQAVEGTAARILDTRKTTPGLRMLEKAAVFAGGGTNHRIGLYDELLIKENHVATAGGVGDAVRRAAAARPDLPLEVEVRSLEELDEALEAGATRVLLDNMDPGTLRAAVARAGGRAWLEASGGVTLETLREIARSGVDFISIGALTHSAPALDLSLLMELIP
jgi:nicotinate-nucleotide pyrophosphorylase (carboxylating)